MSNHNTGTSGEFYVLSVLLRLGIEAYLTLGNTKALDIVYYRDGVRYTIDVKTTEFDADYIFGNTTVSDTAAYLAAPPLPNHFYVFVSYNGQITNPLALPSCYIVPASQLASVIAVTSGKKAKPGTVNPRVGVNAKMKPLKASNALNAWHLL
jgi:hypothetical protein